MQPLCPRRDADGTLVFSLPLAPDARVPFVNPFASAGPVGARIVSAAYSMPFSRSECHMKVRACPRGAAHGAVMGS